MITFIAFTGTGSHSIRLHNVSSLDELTKFLEENPNKWLRCEPFYEKERPIYLKASAINKISIFHAE